MAGHCQRLEYSLHICGLRLLLRQPVLRPGGQRRGAAVEQPVIQNVEGFQIYRWVDVKEGNLFATPRACVCVSSEWSSRVRSWVNQSASGRTCVAVIIVKWCLPVH